MASRSEASFQGSGASTSGSSGRATELPGSAKSTPVAEQFSRRIGPRPPVSEMSERWDPVPPRPLTLWPEATRALSAPVPELTVFSKHPDLSGFFLSVAGRLRPRWVVRENVPAPDVVDFAVALELLGYRVAAFALDSRDFTAQSRRRQFVVGCPPDQSSGFERAVSDAADGHGFSATGQLETTAVAACLTAHPSRMAAEDSYVYEPGRGLRLLDSVEAEGLQGFPRGWTAGFSRSRRRRMLGNAVTVTVAEWIGWRILEAEGLEVREPA